jgi:hypothetical protein
MLENIVAMDGITQKSYVHHIVEVILQFVVDSIGPTHLGSEKASLETFLQVAYQVEQFLVRIVVAWWLWLIVV